MVDGDAESLGAVEWLWVLAFFVAAYLIVRVGFGWLFRLPGARRIERHIILEYAEHDHGWPARQCHLGLVGAGALEQGPSSTPSHHQCEGRPPAFQASHATRAT